MPPSPSLLIPDADVRLLRCDSASGYVNVYPHHNTDAFGRQMYVARVKRDGRLVTLPRSRSPLPHVSARAVVAWYSGRYGPRWRDVFGNRKNRARPKLPPWRAWHSERWGGWLLEVWIDGRPEVVPLMVRRGRRRGRERSWVPHPERPRVFASEAEAVAFAADAPLYRYGVLGMAMRVAREAVWGGLVGPRPPFPGAKPPPRKPDPPPPPFAPALSRAA